jgi:phage tail sheath protein FI
MSTEHLTGIDLRQVNELAPPIEPATQSVIGLIGTAPAADAAKFPIGARVILRGPGDAADIGATGTLKDAVNMIYRQSRPVVVLVREDEGANLAATMTNIQGDATAMTGIHAFKTVFGEHGFEPKILIAPGFTHQRDAAANLVAVDLVSVAKELDGVAILDGPSTSEAAAITYAGDFNGPVMIAENQAIRIEGGQPVPFMASPIAAGLMAGLEVHEAIMNRPVSGVSSLKRGVGYSLTNPSAEVHKLNAAGVTPLVNTADGFAFWGLRAPGSVRYLTDYRIDAAISDAISRGLRWSIGKTINSNLRQEIRFKIETFLRSMQQRGIIYGFRVQFDPELNDEAALEASQIWVDIGKANSRNLERLTIRQFDDRSLFQIDN